MRENCTYGSEGGEADAFPTPINLLAPRRRLLRQPKANNFSHKLGPRVREDDVPLV